MKYAGMPYKQALEQGYKNGRIAIHKGYTSKKINVYEQPVLVAGGYCAGELYIEINNPLSTNYGTLRQYLRK